MHTFLQPRTTEVSSACSPSSRPAPSPVGPPAALAFGPGCSCAFSSERANSGRNLRWMPAVCQRAHPPLFGGVAWCSHFPSPKEDSRLISALHLFATPNGFLGSYVLWALLLTYFFKRKSMLRADPLRGYTRCPRTTAVCQRTRPPLRGRWHVTTYFHPRTTAVCQRARPPTTPISFTSRRRPVA